MGDFLRNRRLCARGASGAWKHVPAIALLFAGCAAYATPSEDDAALWKSATTFHRQGDYAHSVPILRRLLQTNPQNYEATLLLGEDLFLSGRAQESIAPLRMASEARTSDPNPEALLGEAAAALGDFATASEALQAAAARSGEAEQFEVEWAEFSLQRSQALVRILRNTKAGSATMLRVTASSRPEGNEMRASLLEQSAAAGPDQPGIWGELGSAQIALGRYSQAQGSLKQAELRQPHDSETLRLQALFAAMEQRWPDAEEKLAALGARSPLELRRVLTLWPALLIREPK